MDNEKPKEETIPEPIQEEAPKRRGETRGSH